MRTDRRLRNPKNDKLAVMITLALGVLFLWFIFSVFRNASPGDKVEAHIVAHRALSTSQIQIEYAVKNTLDRAGKSYCNIHVQDKSLTYVGYDSGFESAREIQPGETYNGIARLTVSNDGAQYVTEGSVSCTIE